MADGGGGDDKYQTSNNRFDDGHRVNDLFALEDLTEIEEKLCKRVERRRRKKKFELTKGLSLDESLPELPIFRKTDYKSKRVVSTSSSQSSCKSLSGEIKTQLDPKESRAQVDNLDKHKISKRDNVTKSKREESKPKEMERHIKKKWSKKKELEKNSEETISAEVKPGTKLRRSVKSHCKIHEKHRPKRETETEPEKFHAGKRDASNLVKAKGTSTKLHQSVVNNYDEKPKVKISELSMNKKIKSKDKLPELRKHSIKEIKEEIRPTSKHRVRCKSSVAKESEKVSAKNKENTNRCSSRRSTRKELPRITRVESSFHTFISRITSFNLFSSRINLQEPEAVAKDHVVDEYKGKKGRSIKKSLGAAGDKSSASDLKKQEKLDRNHARLNVGDGRGISGFTDKQKKKSNKKDTLVKMDHGVQRALSRETPKNAHSPRTVISCHQIGLDYPGDVTTDSSRFDVCEESVLDFLNRLDDIESAISFTNREQSSDEEYLSSTSLEDENYDFICKNSLTVATAVSSVENGTFIMDSHDTSVSNLAASSLSTFSIEAEVHRSADTIDYYSYETEFPASSKLSLQNVVETPSSTADDRQEVKIIDMNMVELLNSENFPPLQSDNIDEENMTRMMPFSNSETVLSQEESIDVITKVSDSDSLNESSNFSGEMPSSPCGPRDFLTNGNKGNDSVANKQSEIAAVDYDLERFLDNYVPTDDSVEIYSAESKEYFDNSSQTAQVTESEHAAAVKKRQSHFWKHMHQATDTGHLLNRKKKKRLKMTAKQRARLRSQSDPDISAAQKLHKRRSKLSFSEQQFTLKSQHEIDITDDSESYYGLGEKNDLDILAKSKRMILGAEKTSDKLKKKPKRKKWYKRMPFRRKKSIAQEIESLCRSRVNNKFTKILRKIVKRRKKIISPMDIFNDKITDLPVEEILDKGAGVCESDAN